MKTEIVSGEVNPKEIDWSKVQLVKSDAGKIVLTNGDYVTNVFDKTFAGTILVSDGSYQVGHFSDSWSQPSFQPVTEPLTIKFIP